MRQDTETDFLRTEIKLPAVERLHIDGTRTNAAILIQVDDLIEDYKVCRYKRELVQGYPANKATMTSVMSETRLKSAIAWGLALLEKDKTYKAIQFRCQSKPTYKVYALGDVPQDYLRLVPHTYKVDVPQSGIPHPTTIEATVDAKKFHMEKCIESSCIAEFWLMSIVHEKKKVDMVMKSFSIRVDVKGIGIQTVKTPCADNKDDVSDGDELVLFKPKPTELNGKPGAPQNDDNAQDGPPNKKAKTRESRVC